MPVVAELRNVIVGDDTNWRAAVLRTQESLTALQAQSQQATASIGTAFAGMSAPLNGATASFQTLSNEAQIAGATVANAGNGAAASLAPLNGAATAAAQSVETLGSSAIQAGAGVAELSARKAALVAELANVNTAIRSETSVLAGAQSAVQSLGGSHAALNQAVSSSEASLGGYIAKQTLLKGELGNVNTALKAAAGAQTATNVVQGAAAATTQDLGQKTGILSSLFSAHTTQITSQGTAWKGYDNVIQAVIRSMGGIPIVWALAITVGGVLLEKIINHKKAVNDLTGASEELINSDTALLAAFNELSGRSDNVSNSLTGQADRYRELLALDISTTISSYIARFTELDKTITTLIHTQDSLSTAQNRIIAIQQLSTDERQQEILAAQMYGTGLAALKDKVEAEAEAIAKSTTERAKDEEAVAKLADSLIRLRDSTGNSTEAILAMVQAAGAGEDAIARLAAQMDAGAVAARKFAAEWSAAAKAPSFDFSGTTHGLEKLFETATQGANQAIGKFHNFGEEVSANEKNLKPLSAALENYAKVQLVASGKTADAASIASTAKAKLAELASANDYLGVRVQNQMGIMQTSTEKVKEHGAAHRAAVPHVKALTAAIDEQAQFLKQLQQAAQSIIDSINKKLFDIDIGKILKADIQPAVDKLLISAKELSTTQLMNPQNVLSLKELGEAALFGDGSLEALIGRLREAKAANEAAAQAAWADKIAFGELMNQFEIMKDRLPQTWATIVDAIVNGSGKAGAAAIQFGVKVAGALGDVAQVIGNLPGKIGDALRKSVSEFERWFNTIDGILKLLNRVFSSVPAGLGDMLSKVIGIFKKSSQDIEDTMTHTEDEVMNSTTGIAKSADTNLGVKVPKAFGIGAAAAAGFATSLAVAANASSKAMGFLESTITSALAGIAAGFAFGPVAGAIVGGISLIGGIIGLFKGKSAIQKATEQAQLDKLKADVAAQAQATVNAALDGMKSALELFDKLADFTVIPYKNITRFFNQLDYLLQKFVEMSKVFGNGMLDAAKELADKIGPIIGTISQAVGAFEALGGFTGVAQVSVDLFSTAMTRVLQSFIAIKDKFLDAEGFIDSTVNQAKKFAQKIDSIIEVIGAALSAFAGFQTFKNVLPETLDAFAATLELAINKMGDIANAVDKNMIKVAQRFSDRAISVVGLIKAALDAFTPLATFATIPAQAMDAIFAGISEAVNRMQELAATLDTEMLTRAVAVANQATAIFGAIRAGVDSLSSLVDFKAAAPEAFQALLDGFNQAVGILTQMLDKATQFEAIAIQIEDKLTSAAKHLKDGAAAMAAALASAAAVTGAAPGGSVGVASLSAGPSVTGFGIGAPSSPFAGASSGSTTVQTYHVSVTVQGSMLGTKTELQDVVVGAITQAQRRGRATA